MWPIVSAQVATIAHLGAEAKMESEGQNAALQRQVRSPSLPTAWQHPIYAVTGDYRPATETPPQAQGRSRLATSRAKHGHGHQVFCLHTRARGSAP